MSIATSTPRLSREVRATGLLADMPKAVLGAIVSVFAVARIALGVA